MAKNRIHFSTREFRLLFGIFFLFLVGALAFVWSNVRMVKLAYEYQTVAKKHKVLLRENNLLKLERDSLISLDRIRTLAETRVGLKPPEQGQVVTVILK